MNDVKELQKVEYKPENNLVDVIDRTRELKVVKQKGGETIVDENSFVDINHYAVDEALAKVIPLTTSKRLPRPFLYNEDEGIWEEMSSVESAKQHVIQSLRSAVLEVNSLRGNSHISNKINNSITTVAERYVKTTTSNKYEDLLKVSSPNLIAFQNGLYDFKTNELRKLKKEDLQTMKLPYPLIEATETNEHVKYWIDFITLLTGESAELVMTYIGFLFYRSQRTVQTIMVFINGQTNNGRNGKGKLIEFMRVLLGDGSDNQNYTALSLSDLSNGKSDFIKVNLVNKMANFDADAKSKFLKETETLKTLSTNDPITTNVKGSSYVTFESYARLILATNKLPNFRDDSTGFEDRFVVVPFNRYFSSGADGKPSEDYVNYIMKGKKFSDEEKEKHSTPEALGAFAYYCIQLFRNEMKDGLTSNPFRRMMTKEAFNILQQYMYDNDPIQQFLDDADYEVTGNENDFISRDEAYNEFTELFPESKLSVRGFVQALENKGVKSRKDGEKRNARKMINGVSINVLLGIKNNKSHSDNELKNIFG